jgi:hypothetical protein
VKEKLLWGLVGLSMGFQLFGFIFSKTNIATFNQDKVFAIFIQQLSTKHLSDDVIRQKTAIFASRLKETLNTYAQKKHLLILGKEQVLACENDITDDIIHMMARRVKHG